MAVRTDRSPPEEPMAPANFFSLAECGVDPLAFTATPLDPRAHHAGPCTHDCATLMLIDSGKVRWQAGSERIVLDAGDLAILPVGEAHVTHEHERLSGWVLNFMPGALSPVLGATSSDLLLSPGAQNPLLSPLARTRYGYPHARSMGASRERLGRMFSSLEAELRERKWCYEEAAVAQLVLLLVEIGRSLTPVEAPVPPRVPGLAGEALEYIQRHYSEPLSLREVAQAFRANPNHLTTVVRRATGLTVLEWITHFRMAEARRRLAATDEQVEIIAERVGYQSPEHFMRMFRREHGASPTQWRKARQPKGPVGVVGGRERSINPSETSSVVASVSGL